MPTTRRSLPLAITIAVHMLLAACLYLARRQPPPFETSSPQRFLLTLIAPLVRPPVQPPPVRAAAPAPALPRHTQVQPAMPEATVDQPAHAPPTPTLGMDDILVRVRRDIGKIDRELRADAPPAAGMSADSAQARFEHALAGAWIDRSNTLVMDRYVAADGVAITRLSNGSGGGKCFMSGTVNFVPGILHDSARPQEVKCPPPGGGWSRR